MSLLVASFDGRVLGHPYESADELCLALSRLLSIPSDLHGNAVTWECRPLENRIPS